MELASTRGERTMLKCLFWVVAISVLIIVLSLFSCNYGHRPYEPRINDDLVGTLYTIEIDDYGSFWSTEEASRVLRVIADESNNTNTVVLLYVHGWHHNARDVKGGDLSKFKSTLGQLKAKLEQPMYVDSRVTLTGRSDVRVIGIYVGWRGRSMPGFLDYLTIWGRKSAAERVGSGDLREFLANLQKLYELRNQKCKGRLAEECQSTFMGLVLAGHSLGGQVLMKSVSPALESAMISASQTSSWNEVPSTTSVPLPLSAIGDMSVLINPALEAYQFERLHRLNSKLAFNALQTPVLFIVSGEGDTARQIAFPMARSVSRPFRPGFREFQKPLWHGALGEYEPQRTHQLELTDEPDTLSEDSYQPDAAEEVAAEIMELDFTAEVNFGGGKLKPLDGRHRGYSPIVVAYSSEKLIEGHTGIFTDTFRNFLVDYVAFIEGKRMLVNRASSDNEAIMAR
jgi:hypothetical protein